MEREKDIEALIGAEVRKRGGLWLKWVSPGTDGVPDRILILPDGRLIFVELKTARGRPSPVQWHILRTLTYAGQTCVCVCGMRGAERFLRDLPELHRRGRCLKYGSMATELVFTQQGDGYDF